jgi:hypothetical protein
MAVCSKLTISGFGKGTGFTRTVKPLKMCLRLSARGVLFAARRVFPHPLAFISRKNPQGVARLGLENDMKARGADSELLVQDNT